MACLNIIHVKYDSCRAQRKRVILILNISDFREQYLVTKRLSFVSSGFNIENEDGTDSFFTLFPTTYKVSYISQSFT